MFECCARMGSSQRSDLIVYVVHLVHLVYVVKEWNLELQELEKSLSV